jgi:TonB family protein
LPSPACREALATAVADTSDSMPPIERMPVITTFVQAAYPEALQKEGVEGTVLMDLLVSDSGTVDSVAVVGSLHPAHDSAAGSAARAFRFSPAQAGG